MKFVVFLVVVALTVACGEGAVIPVVLPAGVPVAIAAPQGLAIPGATVVQSNPPPVPAAVLIPAAPAPITIDNSSGVPIILAPAAPAIVLAPASPPAVVAVEPAPAPAATSVSANLGAVHVAPLPGHSVSQQQLNLAPAPGT